MKTVDKRAAYVHYRGSTYEGALYAVPPHAMDDIESTLSFDTAKCIDVSGEISVQQRAIFQLPNGYRMAWKEGTVTGVAFKTFSGADVYTREITAKNGAGTYYVSESLTAGGWYTLYLSND